MATEFKFRNSKPDLRPGPSSLLRQLGVRRSSFIQLVVGVSPKDACVRDRKKLLSVTPKDSALTPKIDVVDCTSMDANVNGIRHSCLVIERI